MGDVFIVAAKRTPVVPRGGAFSRLALQELAAPVIQACLKECTVEPSAIDEILVGNALYGGGNPGRLIALSAGLPETVPAVTVDRQCCSGLDAVGLGFSMISAGHARTVLAGGAESFSRSALRSHRPLERDQPPEPYDRPPFTPWQDRDPDMGEAAAALAARLSISRERQWEWAVDSHRKAVQRRETGGFDREMAQIGDTLFSGDPFARSLTVDLCRRTPLLHGDDAYGVDVASTAVEADAAAFLILCNQEAAERQSGPIFRIAGYAVAAADPEWPGLAPIEAARKLFRETGMRPPDFERLEIMEAYAAQAIAFFEAFDVPHNKINAGGGALARGHPIGASGAILLTRLVAELADMPPGSPGLVAIASAGGLGSALIIEKI